MPSQNRPDLVFNALRRATKALDQRVGQVIFNAVAHHHQLIGLKSTQEGFGDPFYIEDYDLARYIDEYVVHTAGPQP